MLVCGEWNESVEVLLVGKELAWLKKVMVVKAVDGGFVIEKFRIGKVVDDGAGLC